MKLPYENCHELCACGAMCVYFAPHGDRPHRCADCDIRYSAREMLGMLSEVTVAYKLFRVRKDGTLGPLFIDRKLVYTEGLWYEAECVPTKGFAVRPGFHATHAPHAPHLKLTADREWRKVLLKDVTPYERPQAQGGLWYTAKQMMVLSRAELDT